MSDDAGWGSVPVQKLPHCTVDLFNSYLKAKPLDDGFKDFIAPYLKDVKKAHEQLKLGSIQRKGQAMLESSQRGAGR